MSTGEADKGAAFVLRVLDAVAEHQPIGVSDLARLLGRPKTTVHRALLTLAGARWVRPRSEDDLRWEIAAKALRVAGRFLSASPLREIAAAPMATLRDRTGESVVLCEREHDEWVSVLHLDGPQTVRVVHALGIRSPLHAGAVGQVILANLGEAAIAAYLSKPLVAVTESTITDPVHLRAVLTDIRARGVATSSNETEGDFAGVAAPIMSNGHAIAGLAVSIPTQRYHQGLVDAYAPHVDEAARAVSAALG